MGVLSKDRDQKLLQQGTEGYRKTVSFVKTDTDADVNTRGSAKVLPKISYRQLIIDHVVIKFS